MVLLLTTVIFMYDYNCIVFLYYFRNVLIFENIILKEYDCFFISNSFQQKVSTKVFSAVNMFGQRQVCLNRIFTYFV